MSEVNPNANIQFIMKHQLLYIGIILLLLFLLLKSCSDRAYDNKSEDSVNEFLNDTISYYENKLGQEVAEKTALNGSKKALELLLSKQIDSTRQLATLVKEFKKVDAAGNITQITKIDSLFVPYKSEVNYMFKQPFEAKTKNYMLKGIVDNKGVLINKLEVPNTLSFVVGKSKGLFNSEYQIQAVNSNPFVKTLGLDSYTLKEKPTPIGIGLQVGYGIGSNFAIAPYIGIGISYNFIRF